MENLTHFLLFLKNEKGQKANTLVTNEKLVRKILKCCSPFTAENFKKLVNEFIDKKYSPSYVHQYVSIVRQWGECFDISELKDYKYPKISYRSEFVRATFEDEEIHQFLAAPNPYPKKGAYHKRYEMWIVFYSILFWHGLRTIEIARLKTGFIDFGRNIIIVPASISKTGETRLVPISPAAYGLLKDYIFNLPMSQKFLFPPFHESAIKKGIEHVQCSDWEYFFKNHIKRLGIKRKNLTAYSGRHTYGTRQADEDVSVFKIKEIMGHKRVETTMKYVRTSLKGLRKVQDNDRMIRSTLSYAKRLLLFRSAHRTLIEGYCKTPAEEKQMIKELYGF